MKEDNNKASMTITKLVAIILAVVLIGIIITGVITGGLKPLGEKIATLANKVLLVFSDDNPTGIDCMVYSADCPGGCKRIDNGNTTGDFSFCQNACYFLKDDGDNNKDNDDVYKYDYVGEKLILGTKIWETPNDFCDKTHILGYWENTWFWSTDNRNKEFYEMEWNNLSEKKSDCELINPMKTNTNLIIEVCDDNGETSRDLGGKKATKASADKKINKLVKEGYIDIKKEHLSE